MSDLPLKILFAGLAIVTVGGCSKPSQSDNAGSGRVTFERARNATMEKKEADIKQRERDRRMFAARPDVRGEWKAKAFDTFVAGTTPGEYEQHTVGPTGYRGTPRQALVDRRTGDELKYIAGDVADRWASMSVQSGSSGNQKSFTVHWGLPPGDGAGTELSIQGEPDDEVARVAVRLLNAQSDLWVPGNRPIILTRRKAIYFGEDGDLYMRRDERAFLDAKVADYYAAQGIEPDRGRTKDNTDTLLGLSRHARSGSR